jgi:TRAP-type C4-dicarboxylate transport system permease small subunit
MMYQRIIVGLICALLFTAYFTLFGASSYFITYLTFSTAIYLILGVPFSFFIDFFLKKNFQDYSAFAKSVVSIILYTLGGSVLIALSFAPLGYVDLNSFLYISLLGASAGFVFFLINIFINKMTTRYSYK